MLTEATIEEKKLRKKSLPLQALWLVLTGLLFIIGLLLVAWAAGALYFDLPVSAPVRNAAAIFWVVAAAVLGVIGSRTSPGLRTLPFKGTSSPCTKFAISTIVALPILLRSTIPGSSI